MADENIDLNAESVEQNIKDIDPRLLRQLEAAEKSMDKEPGYTVDVCRSILLKYPSCVEVRRVLREAQFKKAGKPNFAAKAKAKLQGLVFAVRAAQLMKKGDALRVLSEGEDALSDCPENSAVLGAMADAAQSLQYWGTAAECYRAISVFEPNNDANLILLGNAYLKNKQPEEALAVGDSILRRNGGNGDAQSLVRSASVMKTMLDKWKENSESFRENIKDSGEAADLEKQAGLMNDAETLTRIVERLAVQIKQDPENVNLYRDICASLRMLKRYDDALEYVKQARQQPLGKADTTLEKLEQEFEIAIMEQQIEKVEAELAANPSDEAIKAKLEKLRSEEHSKRIEMARLMVERYPNDFANRYVYGKLMLEDGHLDEAIMQFQLSQRNPNVRQQSLLGLGRAFIQGKKYDLAVDQLETAKRESKLMNDSKKEIIYELAHAYELMGAADKAFSEYKEIYSSDISYRDVSAKINAYYEGKNK